MLTAILCCGFVLTSCSNDDNGVVPTDVTFQTMKEALEQQPRVVSIEAEDLSKLVAEGKISPFKENYLCFFTQPVNHDDPSSRVFKQRVRVIFRGFDRPTILHTCGYALAAPERDNAIAEELEANHVMVEHRNFGESMTDDPQWTYENSRQASADLHDIVMMLKPILKGRWMSMGVSKNGETSIDYCYYYPKDMDLGVAFCSPFFTEFGTTSVSRYMLDESGTAEERALVDEGIRHYLNNGEQGLYKDFCDSLRLSEELIPSFSEYVYDVFDVYFSVFSYTPSKERDAKFVRATDNQQRQYRSWHEMYESNRSQEFYTYYIDCMKEQGLYRPDYDRYSELLEGTSIDEEECVLFIIKEEDRWLRNTYDNTQRVDLLTNFLPTATTPMLFVYSKDDPWTAERPNNINPVTTKLIINPIGIHSNALENTDIYAPETRREIMDYIKRYVYADVK